MITVPIIHEDIEPDDYRVEGLMIDWNKNNEHKIDITQDNVDKYKKKGWTLKEISEGKELYVLSPDLQSHFPGIITYEPTDINIE